VQSLRLPGKTKEKHVALKIIKHADFYKDFTQEAKDEVDILRTILNLNQPEGGREPTKHIVKFLDSFSHCGHLCIAFELLGPDLYAFQTKHGKPGLPLAFIRSVTAQMLEALQCLQQASIIHADLKPENVLLVDACLPIVQKHKPQVKLIDFGGARQCKTFAAMRPGTFVIQTLPYRAPEVLLGLQFTCSADMWSLGCICVEMLLGRSLFLHGGTEYDVVSNAIELLGPLPEHMLKEGRHTAKYFQRVAQSNGLDADATGGRWSKFQSIFRSFLRVLPGGDGGKRAYVYRLKQQRSMGIEVLFTYTDADHSQKKFELRLEEERKRLMAEHLIEKDEWATKVEVKDANGDTLNMLSDQIPQHSFPLTVVLKNAIRITSLKDEVRKLQFAMLWLLNLPCIPHRHWRIGQ